MAGIYWYESTPTVMSADGLTTYINEPAEHRAEMKKDAALAEWVERAESRGEPTIVVHRQAVAKMLEGVDPKAITDAKLDPATTDVAAPKTGSAASKKAAVLAKLSTVLPVAEWEKLLALQATVIKIELAEEPPKWR